MLSAAYDRHDVKRALKISEPYYWKLLREGRLKGFKVGNRWRHTQRDVEQCIEEMPRRMGRELSKYRPHPAAGRHIRGGCGKSR
jgi:hypothetical protein